MIVGFTGTRNGMSAAQLQVVGKLLLEFSPEEFHHGNCIGADVQAETMVGRQLTQCLIHRHPCTLGGQQSIIPAPPGTIVHKEKPPLDRNWDIVDASTVIVATPKEKMEIRRSGTWATIRYARKAGRPLYIVYPDGLIYYARGFG